jgi:RHS repeat-associated protein
VRFTAASGSNRSGIAVSGYEYRKYQSGSTPTWLPLRFPGQYYDAESDLFQNWNRFYEANTGRYLAPEPLWLYPDRIIVLARQGKSVPVYAYAGNDPIVNEDSTGLETSELENAALEAQKAINKQRANSPGNINEISTTIEKATVTDDKTGKTTQQLQLQPPKSDPRNDSSTSYTKTDKDTVATVHDHRTVDDNKPSRVDYIHVEETKITMFVVTHDSNKLVEIVGGSNRMLVYDRSSDHGKGAFVSTDYGPSDLH